MHQLDFCVNWPPRWGQPLYKGQLKYPKVCIIRRFHCNYTEPHYDGRVHTGKRALQTRSCNLWTVSSPSIHQDSAIQYRFGFQSFNHCSSHLYVDENVCILQIQWFYTKCKWKKQNILSAYLSPFIYNIVPSCIFVSSCFHLYHLWV